MALWVGQPVILNENIRGDHGASLVSLDSSLGPNPGCDCRGSVAFVDGGVGREGSIGRVAGSTSGRKGCSITASCAGACTAPLGSRVAAAAAASWEDPRSKEDDVDTDAERRGAYAVHFDVGLVNAGACVVDVYRSQAETLGPCAAFDHYSGAGRSCSRYLRRGHVHSFGEFPSAELILSHVSNHCLVLDYLLLAFREQHAESFKLKNFDLSTHQLSGLMKLTYRLSQQVLALSLIQSRCVSCRHFWQNNDADGCLKFVKPGAWVFQNESDCD